MPAILIVFLSGRVVSSPGYLQAGEHQRQHTLGRWISQDHGSSGGWQNRLGAQSSQHRGGPPGEHVLAKFCIVRRLLLGLGKVPGISQGFHGPSMFPHCFQHTVECSTVSVCSHMANEGGFSVCKEVLTDFLGGDVFTADGCIHC
uniref:Uncharacterized protein n=1 Tax=Magallana gigas TaxID=29159 RepID=K1PZB0_MAGGI